MSLAFLRGVAAAASLACCAVPLLALAEPASGSMGRSMGLDDAVLDEINFARTRPADYARDLERGMGYGENAADVEEAIDFLQRQRPLPPLEADQRIAAAAQAHASAQGRRGDVGHGPAGSLGQRLRQNGVWASLSAENISYGYDDPRDIVRQLIVDSGVPGRGHRKNIFTGAYRSAGVACGPHRSYGAMCVIDFAGAIVQR
ncbi:MAG: CAP domain-containing protein [Caulobacter sp.]|nr:CAP domain-containing protein [Caulobacter sp.]